MRILTTIPFGVLAVGLLACESEPAARGGPADSVRVVPESAGARAAPGTDGTVGPDAAVVPDPAAVSDTAAPPAGTPGSGLRGYDTVFVYFDGPMPDGATAGPLVARPRAVPDTGALAFALGELLAGPTAADTAAVETPLYSWFSEETAGMLEGVTLDEGVVVVEFADFRSIIPGASSSAGSAALLRQLEATVFQFPEVGRVEFRIEGSCEAFMAWLQIGCVPVPRSSFAEPEGYRQAVRR